MIPIVTQHKLITIFGLLELARLLKGQPALQNLQDLLGSLRIGAEKLLKLEKLGARFHGFSDSPRLRTLDESDSQENKRPAGRNLPAILSCRRARILSLCLQ